MSQDTSLLLGLDGLAAERVELDAEGCPVVHVVTADVEAARCPSWRVVSTSPKQWVTTLKLPRSCGHLTAWDDGSRGRSPRAEVTSAVPAGVPGRDGAPGPVGSHT